MNIDQLRDTLKIDEGVKYEIYNDHLGYPTFGNGHLVVESDEEHGKPLGTPVSEERVNAIFEEDVKKYFTDIQKDISETQDSIEEEISFEDTVDKRKKTEKNKDEYWYK